MLYHNCSFGLPDVTIGRKLTSQSRSSLSTSFLSLKSKTEGIARKLITRWGGFALSRPQYFASHAALRQFENKAGCSNSPIRRSFHSFSHRRKDKRWWPKELSSVSRERC